MSNSKMRLKDYQPSAYEILSIHLDFDLNPEVTRVRSRLKIKKLRKEPLILNGESLKLVSISLNDQPVQYQLTEKTLTLESPLDHFDLEIVTEIHPAANTALEGLYLSKGLLATQCEAQGFRRITYFLDRPDVMTTYTVTLRAPRKQFPILLSNGNLVDQKDLGQGQHQVTWHDPFKKPCYLFALVAGDLGVLKDEFTTKSGEKVQLEIYGPHGKQIQCEHAMNSLKKSMAWDEVAYGREYDLKTFMIVAIEDFNMGAMENKGLNIFNSSLVFADEKTATDLDYLRIESVVAHEYFHNWTGNRITCRDWFHLSLKEGLTVFRDQEFSSDMHDRAVQRIQDVDSLRSRQFPEDAGPNAHPVRPEEGASMDNFYTATIYEKGAEVIRMMRNLVGSQGFRKGMDLYFERYDGQAVTIEEFVGAIADANKIDLTLFKRWYHQPGTPHIFVRESFDSQKQIYHVELEQKTNGEPQHIPLFFGLLDEKGREVPVKSSDITRKSDGNSMMELKSRKQTFSFPSMDKAPFLSLNREFSAPVILKWKRPLEDWLMIMKHDQDGFNRREAALEVLFQYFDQRILEGKTQIDERILEAFRSLILDDSISAHLKAELFHFPSDSLLAQRYEILEPLKVEAAKKELYHTLGFELRREWRTLYSKLPETQGMKSEDFGVRNLKMATLGFWAESEDSQAHAIVSELAMNSPHMGLRLSSLRLLLNHDLNFKDSALEKFQIDWQHDSLVMNKWFLIQSTSSHLKVLHEVQRLAQHPLFEIKNPNKVYSLIRAFGQNLLRFYDPHQKAWIWYAQKILEIDRFNPQVAARLCDAYNFVPKLQEDLRSEIRASLEPLKSADLSPNVKELISRV